MPWINTTTSAVDGIVGTVASTNYPDIHTAKSAESTIIPFGRAIILKENGWEFIKSSTDITTDGDKVAVCLVTNFSKQYTYNNDYSITTTSNSGIAPNSYGTGAYGKGDVYVASETDVNQGDAVYIRVAVGSGTVLGSFRNDADTNTCEKKSGWIFLKDAAAGQPVPIHMQ